ncbi:MAG: proteinral L-amino acid transport system permease [Beijerinckiaceae bacterium]|nr:MAG: proteinral L-amino acid transport system permease [Beijerinckiaceae bacterium]
MDENLAPGALAGQMAPTGALQHAYVQNEPAVSLPPPASMVGVIGWLRANLLSSPGNIALTIIAALIAFWLIPGFIKFLITDAVWSGADREACITKNGITPGACWAFVRDRYSFFIYGFYPFDQRWRVDLFFVLGALGVTWMLWLGAPRRDIGLFYFIIALPLVSYGLLSGNNPFGFVSFAPQWLKATACLLVFLFAYLMNQSDDSKGALGFMTLFGFIISGVLLAENAWSLLKLSPVETSKWGGLMVTLVVAGVGIVASLPLGILLALGRRSKLPVVKFFSVMFIEFVRGVPLITVLFMANTMLPLFMPDGWHVDKLLRALVGIYMAEVVRAGLQALPKGQYEGAMAVGLGYWQMMRLIILPQALKVTIPNIVNTYIGLFKDTSLLLIVGIFDFLKAIETARIDPQWAAPTTSPTGYAFAAIVYFIFCYGMASYARATERRLSVADKR